MGTCFTKNSSNAALTPTPQQFELKSSPQQTKNEQQVFKKEIFVIKHRISHEIDRHPDEDGRKKKNPSGEGESGGARVRTSSCTKEEVDAILIQCGRLSRSSSAGAENPNRRRRYSFSKRSFDFDLDTGLKNDDDEALNHHHHRHRQQELRVSSPSSRRSSRERDPRQQRSGSKERGSGSDGVRRVSISPSRRSESPFPNLNGGAAGGGSSRPAKMVPVPATDKSNSAGGGEQMVAGVVKMVSVPATNKSNIPAGGGEQVVAGVVKRIHVMRNVGDAAAAVVSRTAASPRSRSPGRAILRILTEDHNQEQRQQPQSNADHLPYRRNPLADIDNNAATTSAQPSNKSKEEQVEEAKTAVMMVPKSVESLKLRQNITRTRTQASRLSRDLDINPQTILDPIPPSYASLLLEDIHNFHQKNTTNASGTAPPAFSLPACISKACSIMEAVADLNSTTSSLFSEDRWRNPTRMEQQVNEDSLVESETVVNDELVEASFCNYVTVRRAVSAATEEQESSGSNTFAGSQHLNCLSPSLEPKSADPTTGECKERPLGLGGFQRELLDYPRKGIGRGRRRAYSRPNSTTVAST